MVSFRETWLEFLSALLENIVNDEEFVLLNNINTSENTSIFCYTYDYFELNKLRNDEWLAEIPSQENDFSELTKMNLPEKNEVHICIFA